MFSRVMSPQVVPGTPRGRTGGSLQRVAEVFIFHWFYKVIFKLPLGQLENDGFHWFYKVFVQFSL